MRLLPIATVMLMSLPGCAPIIPEGRFGCEADLDCPPGLVCRADGRCRSPGTAGVDAGNADGGIPELDASLDGGDGGVPTLDGGDGGAPTIDGGDGGVPTIDAALDGGNADGGAPTVDAGLDGGAPMPDAAFEGAAVRVSSPTARVLVRDTAGLFTSVFTWEIWASFDSAVPSDPPQVLMEAVDLNPANPYSLVYLRVLYSQLDCVVGTGTGDVRASVAVSSISSGVMHHIVCMRSATEQSLWVDGVRVASVAPGIMPLPGLGTRLGFGGNQHVPAQPQSFRGVIDEIRISSVARYVAGTFVPARRHTVDGSTLGLWHLDEGAGLTTADAAGGHTGALEGATWVAEP